MMKEGMNKLDEELMAKFLMWERVKNLRMKRR